VNVSPVATPPIAWPSGWDDVEVVDSVLVDVVPVVAPPRIAPPPGGVVYDRAGRMTPAEPCGRLVSVLA
jgi:hypothetical protein